MVKNPTANAGDPGSIPGSARSPGEGNGYPPQYSCLENSMNRGAWQAAVMGSQESDTTDFHFLFFIFQKCSKTFIYALSSLNHVNIYLPHTYSSLIIQHELGSLRALIYAVFPGLPAQDVATRDPVTRSDEARGPFLFCFHRVVQSASSVTS